MYGCVTSFVFEDVSVEIEHKDDIFVIQNKVQHLFRSFVPSHLRRISLFGNDHHCQYYKGPYAIRKCFCRVGPASFLYCMALFLTINLQVIENSRLRSASFSPSQEPQHCTILKPSEKICQIIFLSQHTPELFSCRMESYQKALGIRYIID